MKIITVVGVLLVGACSSNKLVQLPVANAAPVAAAEDEGSGLVVADSGSVTNSLDSEFSVAPPSQLSVSEESDLVFNILTAEIAGRLGMADVASENYFDASISSDDPRVSERAVKLAIYGNDAQRAELASSRWVELAPENMEAWQHRAQALIQVKDVDKAAEAIEKVVALSEDEPGSVLPSIVDSILRQSDPDMGSQLLEKLASRYPDNASMQFGIGQFAMANGERDLAMKAFDRALSIDPDNVETLLARARLQLTVGAGDVGLEPVTEYLSRSPDDLSAQLGYARLLIGSGKIDKAADQLETVNRRFPDDADALYTIGLLALDIQRLGRAENYLTAVTRLDRHQNDANFYLGRISDNRTDYQEAIDRYLTVRGGENFFSAQIRAAELHGLMGELGKGRALLGELRSIADEQPLQIELINAESRLLNSDNQYEESLQLLTEGIEQYNEAPALLYTRALVAERLNLRDVFEADLLKVIEVQPDNSHALNALGYFLVNRNERLDKAEEYLVEAHNLSPDDAAITDSLGWLYYRQGRYVDSIRLLQQAYASLPDPEIAAHLGEVLWVSGDQAQAAKVWEEALRDAPDDNLLKNVMKKYIR